MYIDLELCITFFAVIRCNNFIIIFESYVQMFLLHYLQFALNCCIYDWVSITSANTFNWKIMIFFSLFYEFQTNITSSLLSGIREEKSMTSSPLSKEPVSWNEKHDPKVRKIRWWIIEMWIRKVQTIHNSWKQYFSTCIHFVGILMPSGFFLPEKLKITQDTYVHIFQLQLENSG